MAAPEAAAGSPRREENGPPCRRCHGRVWDVEVHAKAGLRRVIENIFAAPDVWIFQGESGGWPARTYERWMCTSCGRRVRL